MGGSGGLGSVVGCCSGGQEEGREAGLGGFRVGLGAVWWPGWVGPDMESRAAFYSPTEERGKEEKDRGKRKDGNPPQRKSQQKASKH